MNTNITNGLHEPRYQLLRLRVLRTCHNTCHFEIDSFCIDLFIPLPNVTYHIKKNNITGVFYVTAKYRSSLNNYRKCLNTYKYERD